MRKFFTYLALGTALSCSLSATAAPTLYGVKVYSKQSAASGLYSIEATAGAQPQLYWSDGDMMGTAGAVYTDDKLLVLNYIDFFGMTIWSYLTCDVQAKTYDAQMPETLKLTDVAGVLAYDPSSDVVYATCLASLDPSSTDVVLATMDKATGAKTPVANLPENLYALACTANGVLYGITADGTLNKVNKSTGALTPVGDTGIKPNVNQSAVVEYATGTMYWSVYTDDTAGLYTVDLATAETTCVTTYDNQIQFTGLFIEQTAPKNDAPTEVTNLTTSFEGASLEGTVTFTLPDKDINDVLLSGPVTWSVLTNETVLATDSGNPGETITTPVTLPKDGNTMLVVTVEAGGLTGRAANTSFWAGMDTPLQVTDCMLAVDGADVTLSWTLPEKGVHGGYVDPAKVLYRIDRGPEDTMVAEAHNSTTFSESIPVEDMRPVLYRITPYIGELKGEPVLTSYELVGENFKVPFEIDLKDQFNTMLFTAFDLNNDDCTWEYDFDAGFTRCQWPIAETSDDWYVTPPIFLEPGYLYTFSMKVRSEGKWNYEGQCYEDVYAGTLGIGFGSEPTPDKMTTAMPDTDVESIEWKQLQATGVKVAEPGNYYFGIHLSGKRSIYYAYLDNISMTREEENSISSIDANVAASVAVNGSTLSVANPEGSLISIFTVAGQMVGSSSLTDYSVTLAPGIYLVSVGSHTFKVAL